MGKARGETSLPKNRGTGFEDGYADPPVTPQEHTEELDIYAQHRPFHERIEECIHRYTSRRRLPQDRAQLFSRYLYLGGIDTTQRQFTGTAQHIKGLKDDNYSVDEIREITANEFLGRDGEAKGLFYSPDAPEHWDVDFAGLAAGFLGSYLAEATFANCPEIAIGADTVLNFLNYICHHDVCPEYNDNIKQALNICRHAKTDLEDVAAAGLAFPGDFNLACRVLFCSTGVPHSPDDFVFDHQLYEDKKAHQLSDGEMVTTRGAIPSCMVVPTTFDHEMVFKTTIALQRPELIPLLSAQPPRVIHTFDETYEVAEIQLANDALVDVYAGITKHDSTLRPINPVGRATLSPSIIEDGWDNHPTLAEGRADNPGTPVSVYLEHGILVHLRDGVKLRATICRLDLGESKSLDFVKAVAEVVPSWHVYLPQQLMIHYKAPRPDARLPPSATDPDVEERRLQAIAANEEREEIKEMRKVDVELDREMQGMEDMDALQKLMARTEI